MTRRLLVTALLLSGCGFHAHLRRNAADVIERRRVVVVSELTAAKEVFEDPDRSEDEERRAHAAVAKALDSAVRMLGWTAPLVKDVGEVKPDDQLELGTDEEREKAEVYQAETEAKVFLQDWWRRLLWNPVTTFLKDTAWNLAVRWGPWLFVVSTLWTWWRARVNRRAAVQGENVVEAIKGGASVADAVAREGGRDLARLHVGQKVRRANGSRRPAANEEVTPREA